MDTVRVDICYRPLRIGWVIRSDDFDTFRKVVRYSHALWGGRFNPILFVDHEEESSRLIDLFRVDVIIPVGVSDEVRQFADKYPHLINPFFHDSVFMLGSENYHPYSNVLDIHNALAYLRDRPEWKGIKDAELHSYSWGADDPLADVFLTQLGRYPDVDDVGTDYLDMLKNSSECVEIALDLTAPIPTTAVHHPSIAYLSRHGLKRHHSVDRGWHYPGFFVGSVRNLEDLVCHWNLRACDLSLWFVDRLYLDRYSDLIPEWEKVMQDKVANYRNEWDRKIAVWTRLDDLDAACKPFGDAKLTRCQVSDWTWNGRNVRAPMMYFGEVSVLGVMNDENTRPKITFALSDKPFCGDTWFHQQHLVASISFIGGLYGDEQHTLHAPYLPELNEFYARTMHFEYNKLRVEPERIGIVIDAADHDSSLYALPIPDLIERVFDMAGYESKLSTAGLITKQLIARLDGVQGCRVFKIPGVRRLLKLHGPSASITKRAALQIIGSKDPDRLDATFKDHEDLHVEARPRGKVLTPDAVFGYLVEKGLFRVGADLTCPSCRMNSWMPVDSLKHMVVCDLCGHEHDATRQLTDFNEWHYRRSGVLGVEKNAQGAVPVALTLQQLDTSFHGGLRKDLYSPSLDLTPKEDTEGNKCETDFVWVIPGAYSRKTIVILAECKDQGPITEGDVANLKRITDALPRKRFKTFVILSQIAPFTEEEIEIAKTLNDKYCRRVILLTARELEPYFIHERTKKETGVDSHWSTPEDMAEATARIYFTPEDNNQAGGGDAG